MLAVKALRKRFGGLWAVDGVSFILAPGQVIGLIGPNGSGKTTLLNTINGVYPPDGGEIVYQGRTVSGLPPHRMARQGVSRTFQAARVFSTLTAGENMLLPTLPAGRPTGGEEERARGLLESVNLGGMWTTPASELSGGQQKLLEFARCQMMQPTLLLMDEPFAGVHPEIVRLMTLQVSSLRDQGLGVIVVSHEIPVLMQLADEVICMSEGRTIAHGAPAEVEQDPQVLEAYIGSGRSVRRDEAPARG